MTNAHGISRRAFLGSTLGAAITVPVIADPPSMRITGFRFLLLRFPETLPRKRNATIWSGGGQAA